MDGKSKLFAYVLVLIVFMFVNSDSVVAMDQTGWTFNNVTGGTISFVYESDSPSGGNVMQLYNTQRATPYADKYYSLSPYSSYLLNIQYKKKAGYTYYSEGGGFSVRIWNGGVEQQSSGLKDEDITDDWQVFQRPVVTGSSGTVLVRIYLESSIGKIMVDDESFTSYTYDELKELLGTDFSAGLLRIPLTADKVDARLWYDEIVVTQRKYPDSSNTFLSEIGFQMRSTFSAGWNSCVLKLELPDEISVRSNPYGANVDGVSIGSGYKRYSFDSSYIVTDGNDGYLLLALKLNAPIDTDADTATYWTEWTGGSQSPVTVPVKEIEIPYYAQPKIITTGTTSSDKPWVFGSDETHASLLESLGFNFISYWKMGNGDTAISELRDHGIKTETVSSGFDEYTDMIPDFNDARATNLLGQKIDVLDLTHRGEIYDGFIDDVNWLASLNFTGIQYDDEYFQFWRGMDIDTGSRTDNQWRNWLSAYHPGVPYASVVNLLTYPVTYNDQYNLWWQFKASLARQWYDDAKAEWISRVNYYYNNDSPEMPWFTLASGGYSEQARRESCFDYNDLSQTFDHFSPQYYCNSYKVRNRTEELVNLVGGSKACPLLCMGESTSNRDEWKPGEIKAQILEALFARAKGYLSWKWSYSNLRIIAEMAQTNGVIADNEAIFVEGAATTSVFWVENQSDRFATVLETSQAGLLLVSNYDSNASQVTIDRSLSSPAVLIEQFTGEMIVVDRNASSFIVDVQPKEVKLYKYEYGWGSLTDPWTEADFDAWTNHYSSGDTPIQWNSSYLEAEGSGNCQHYNHLERDIDGSGNFYVEAKIRADAANPSIVVWWDATHYVALNASWNTSYMYSEHRDGGSKITEDCTEVTGQYWSYATVQIEFSDDTIRFFGKKSDSNSLTELSSLELPRTAGYRGEAAKVIVGKGWDGANETFNNDLGSAGAWSFEIKYVDYSPVLADGWGSALDPWTEDDFNLWANHRSSGDTAIQWDSNGISGAYAQGDRLHYNHLEKNINGSGNFYVETKIRADATNPTVVVWWDATHYVALNASWNTDYMYSEHRDGGSKITEDCTEVTGQYWAFATIRIEFSDNTVKFFGKKSDSNSLTELTSLELHRGANFKGEAAKVIVGKGWDGASETYNNDSGSGGTWEFDIKYVDYGPLLTEDGWGSPMDLWTENDFETWTIHHSPNDMPIQWDSNYPWAAGSGNCQHYNHLEKYIDGSGDFLVETNTRADAANPSIVVWWDATHYVALNASWNTSYMYSEHRDGGSKITEDCTEVTGQYWSYATVQIEFSDDTIRFFGKNSDSGSLTELSSLELPRTAGYRGEAAKVIVGKGWDGANETFNNDLGSAGAWSFEIKYVDYRSFEAFSPSPASGALDVNLTPTLSWVKSRFTASHDVYFGTNQTNVADANHSSGEYKGNQAGTTYNPGMLTANTIYYWRIDEVGVDGTTKGVVWSFTISAPGQAHYPSPVTSAANVSVTTVVLSWIVGSNTTSHDVYFGTNQISVTNATHVSSEYKSNRAGAYYVLGTLSANTTYYWRVDEIGGGGTTPGTVWSFTTAVAPGQAISPSPANNAVNITLYPTLTWTAGSGTHSHNVYFGTTNPPAFIGNQAAVSYTPTGPLLIKTKYYWRIDEVGNGGTTTGDVWSFTTVDKYTEKFQDITIGTANAWTDVDLSSYGVLANQVVEIGIRNGSTSTARDAGVRIKGSSLARKIVLHAATTAGWDMTTMTVKIDANKKIQAYAANISDVHFYLVGIWNSGDYTEKFQALTIGTTGSWVDSAALSTYGVGANQVVDIMASKMSTTAYIAGIRTNGSALDRKLTLHASTSSAAECLVMQAKADASMKIEVWKGNTSVTFTLLGYWTTAPGTYTEKFVDVGKPTSSATWYTRSLSGQSVPANAICEMLIANGSTSNHNNVGIRQTDSSLSRLFDIHKSSASAARECGMMHVVADSSSNIQQYLQNQADTVNFYLLGYWN